MEKKMEESLKRKVVFKDADTNSAVKIAEAQRNRVENIMNGGK